MILAREDIIEEYKKGNIIISPLSLDLIGTNSVDFRLSDEFYTLRPEDPEFLFSYDNDYIKQKYIRKKLHVKTDLMGQYWCYYSKKLRTIRFDHLNIEDDDKFIILAPGEFVLGVSKERIGTTPGSNLVPSMYARSTTGRQGLSVCLCAGLGDVGYHSRWTLEVHNLTHCARILAVNTVIGQIVFQRTTPTSESYGGVDRYQKQKDYNKDFQVLPKAFRIVRN